MQKQLLGHVVSRTRTKDLKPILERWGWLEQEVEQIDLSKTKREITNSLIEVCNQKEGLTKDVCGELDLICTQEYSTKKQWSVFLMEKEDEHYISDSNLSNPLKLKKKLKSEITVFFERENVVSVRMLNGVLWMRVYIQSGPRNMYRSSDTVYIIYYPRTQYILLSRYKKSVESYLIQSIQNVMGCDKLTNSLLTGTHYESLLQLALDRKSQGDFSRYRLQQVQNLPLLQKPPQKRKVSEFEREPNLQCEDERHKRQRTEELDECFGPNEQPLLQKLEFKVAVKFRGTSAIPSIPVDDMQPFRCRVKFEGPSVIDGIRNLAECGLVTMPYPKYLRSVHTLGKNHIKLADKTAMQHNVSQVNQSHAEQNENTPAKNTRSRSKPRTRTRT
ncbi:CENPN [Mytilus edulis]|uniref:CENPN n=1 Tax=Mytilus edulis TaxID=6550 RepID=A0A8S3TH04_MYTED|nr:CENPN [Mytilus edulis]